MVLTMLDDQCVHDMYLMQKSYNIITTDFNGGSLQL